MQGLFVILSPAPLGKAVFAVGSELVLNWEAKSRTFSGKAVNEKRGMQGLNGLSRFRRNWVRRMRCMKSLNLWVRDEELGPRCPWGQPLPPVLCHPMHCALKFLHITIWWSPWTDKTKQNKNWFHSISKGIAIHSVYKWMDILYASQRERFS